MARPSEELFVSLVGKEVYVGEIASVGVSLSGVITQEPDYTFCLRVPIRFRGWGWDMPCRSHGGCSPTFEIEEIHEL